MIPVMNPPNLKSIFEGDKLAKSLAGLTILAAILVARVEMMIEIIANATTQIFVNLLASTTGSHIDSPNTMIVADVTTTPIKAKNVIDGGSPMACPII